MLKQSLRLVGAVAGLALLVPLAACSATPAESKTTLTFATGQSEPDCLDPHVGGNWPQAESAHQFLESLFARDDSGEIVPWLADSSEVSEDGLTWTIGLKEGIEFSDGTPFNAAAVVANMEHVRDPNTKSSTGILALEKVDAIVATDDHTVEFQLNTPDSALLESLAQSWLAIMSPAGLERGEQANCEAPIGTGAFQVDSWTKQDRIVFVRNETHTEAMPGEATPPEGERIERIEWRFIPDAATRTAALQSGQVDVIDQVQPDALSGFQETDEFSTLVGPRPGTTARIELNTTRAPFDDPLVREAFTRSTDIDAAVESLYFGTLDRSYSPLSSALPESVGFPELLGVDVDQANQLLDEAGWTERNDAGIRIKDGQPLTVVFPLSTNQSIPAEVSLVEQIAASAGAVGFDVQIELLDIGSWYAASGEWAFDAIIAPYSKSSADVLRIVYHSAGNVPAPSGYHANNTGIESPELDAMLEQAGTTTDRAERADLYAQAQEFIVSEHLIVPLYDQMVQFAYTPTLEGLRLDPSLNLITFTNASFK
ncbi:ABC transporter substrate-binding protein [Gulosibacter molinativorax]|uniref:Peptide ABC transporter substrate-binding protein n=1 Tax=Gulosibacter molinativorax TaxID=256821 RepID=A0ABT7CAD6_9MICO|nr:ABC transporter substrate-binding protein [Gulosibacter molinativorax]MDJ1372171.1 peptide ABC transporter substrate-binding protein [Gulosibacter molinativorax]QUY60958.1 Peptide/nickel transport system substrate-binding protein [Gulosibacter molinativorax]